jgi:Arm DNA-binding domain
MLTDQAIKAGIREATAGAKALKRFDERGLFILLKPNGSALPRFKYYFGGLEKGIGLGAYPDVSLKRAREKRDDVRREVADGIDPSATRKAAKRAEANSVEAVAVEWLAGQQAALDAGTLKRHRSRLERFVFPFIGSRPVAKVTAADLLEILRRIEKSPRRNFSNRETAKRVRQLCGQVWRFAIATQRAERDISADLRGVLARQRAAHGRRSKLLGAWVGAQSERRRQTMRIKWRDGVRVHVGCDGEAVIVPGQGYYL